MPIHKSSYCCGRILSVITLVFGSWLAVVAETAESEFNIRLTGDAVEANLADDNSSWAFIGNVRLERGSVTLVADRMTVNRKAGKLVAVVAKGNPVQFKQVEPTQVTANAATITYDIDRQTLVLEGGVELLQHGNEVRGDRIEYDIRQGELIAGSKDPTAGQQIEFVLDNDD